MPLLYRQIVCFFNQTDLETYEKNDSAKIKKEFQEKSEKFVRSGNLKEYAILNDSQNLYALYIEFSKTQFRQNQGLLLIFATRFFLAMYSFFPNTSLHLVSSNYYDAFTCLIFITALSFMYYGTYNQRKDWVYVGNAIAQLINNSKTREPRLKPRPMYLPRTPANPQ